MFIVIKNYFVEKLTPSARHLHYSIFFLVLLQIILSNFIEINDDGVIGQRTIEYYSTLAHIGVGLSLVGFALVFTIVELSNHGFLYFYPYLSGDLSQLKSDLSKLKSLEIPSLSPQGLAAIIQGLGLGALLLVVLSGATWFVLWLFDLAVADDVKEIHELLTGLIQVYLVGHGAMGLIHIFIAYKAEKTTSK